MAGRRARNRNFSDGAILPTVLFKRKRKKMNAQSELQANFRTHTLPRESLPSGHHTVLGPLPGTAVTPLSLPRLCSSFSSESMYFLFSFFMRVISERPALSENTSTHVAKDAYQDCVRPRVEPLGNGTRGL